MELQHVNVKVLLKNANELDLGRLIPIFHNWIKTQDSDELLLDVADYRHVHDGPGMVLIGHHGDYSVDNTGGRLGVRYNRKVALEGTNQDRLIHAAQKAIATCQRLENEPGLEGALKFDGHTIQVSINDRLLAPNTPETRAAADLELRPFFRGLFGNSEYDSVYAKDPRSLFSVRVRSALEFDTASLLQSLDSMTLASIPQ